MFGLSRRCASNLDGVAERKGFEHSCLDRFLICMNMEGVSSAFVKACGKTLRLVQERPRVQSFHGGLRILCLDGGGMRGVVTLRMLKALEDESGAPIGDLFDLVVGTSTGGILAAALALKRFRLESCEELYSEMGSVLFGGHGTLIKALGVLGSSTAQYPHAHENLAELLSAVLRTFEPAARDPTLGDFFGNACRFACVAGVEAGGAGYDPYVFRSYEGRNFTHLPKDSSKDVPIWQALRATSAAPYYFKSMDIGRNVFVDGGVTANNPSSIAIEEARALGIPIHCLVSIGTGVTSYMPAKKIGFWSRVFDMGAKISPLQKLVGEATDAHSIHIEVSRLPELQGRYFRFDVPIAGADLAETQDDILQVLRNSADKYLSTDVGSLASMKLASHILQSPSYVPASPSAKALFSQVIRTHHDADWKRIFGQAPQRIRMSFAYFGRNVRDASAEIEQFLHRGGTLDVIFPDHESQQTMEALRCLMPWQFQTVTPEQKVKESLTWLCQRTPAFHRQIHVRLIPKIAHYSMYIVGPDPISFGACDIRHGFMSVFQEKESSQNLSVRSPLIDVGDSQALSFLVDEFHHLWSLQGARDFPLPLKF